MLFNGIADNWIVNHLIPLRFISCEMVSFFQISGLPVSGPRLRSLLTPFRFEIVLRRKEKESEGMFVLLII